MGGMPGFEWLAEPAWESRVVFRAGDPPGLASAAASGLGLAAIPCILGETEPSLRRVETLGVGFRPRREGRRRWP
jgi:DNA-binding transcriptional LysR family regulator